MLFEGTFSRDAQIIAHVRCTTDTGRKWAKWTLNSTLLSLEICFLIHPAGYSYYYYSTQKKSRCALTAAEQN